MYKIDFEKVYDRVDWQFQRNTLSRFGFPSNTTNLIMNCIFATALYLRWNNEVLESFSPVKGLQQGDPLSLYLFVFCMEQLACFIQDMVNDNTWHPTTIAKKGLAFSHLFFCR